MLVNRLQQAIDLHHHFQQGFWPLVGQPLEQWTDQMAHKQKLPLGLDQWVERGLHPAAGKGQQAVHTVNTQST